ncbi:MULTISPECIES: AMP-binding protein [Brachybacterium]|uniref:Acyl-CoA synthetase n=2 Tax=Brachybacterium TaxID=43668 RepID=A0A426SL97_9MICO|nr:MULTISPECIES: AMP-binding protein [Brachybacterium]MCT1437275.1 AMP-binding protein [Brachybacterium paraconglomeratum]RRR18997.1 acyl-CoA synthetase [Brachybacterium paraconglomeratum]GLI30526.1 acyl-CoA synthetase [Brachybacterium conglomeratum]GLK05040.1 acyl-CoA synthetase [Brachybacterium conglomeratum]
MAAPLPDGPAAASPPWLVPPAYDASAASLAAHSEAIGEVMAGRARLWLGPFPAPDRLPAGLEDTALVVPTSGSTGTAKAVALSLAALRASQDATAQLFAADGTAPDSRGHGFWLPLLPPTHIAGVQVLARAHRTGQVQGIPGPALPDPLPDLRGHFDAAAFVELAGPVLEQAERAGLPAMTSLVPTQLTRIVTGATGDDARARGLLKRFAAVLVGGAATSTDVLARARGQRIPVRTTYGSSETAGGCVYDRRPLPGVSLSVLDPDESGAGRLRISSPTLALGYLTEGGGTDGGVFAGASPSADGPAADAAVSGAVVSRESADRAFLTSDLAEIGDDGALTVLGRADDVINTGGRKVLPQDVERAIDRSLMLRGLVRTSVVVGVPDPEWGQRVEALVTLEEGTDPAEASALVRSALRTTEVPAHMIPKRVHVVEELPLLGIGKVDRAAARRLAGG